MKKGAKEIIFARIEQEESLKHDKEFVKQIKKMFDTFGEDDAMRAIETEYANTARLEQEYTNLRWRTYTTLSAISFAIAGYVLSTVNALLMPGKTMTLFFAWFIHFFATFHYWWMHKLTHSLRDYLKKLECLLGFYSYTLRSRRPVPEIKLFKKRIQFKFHWVVYAVTILYLAGIIWFAVKGHTLVAE